MTPRNSQGAQLVDLWHSIVYFLTAYGGLTLTEIRAMPWSELLAYLDYVAAEKDRQSAAQKREQRQAQGQAPRLPSVSRRSRRRR